MRTVLEQVAEYAAAAHGNQKRKFVDEPYIRHPIRVMEICSEFTSNTAVLAAALLHDVLDDTPVRKDEMHSFLLTVMDPDTAEQTVNLVDSLTDRYTKSNYPEWNRRKRKLKESERLGRSGADAQTIKYADIIDNCTEFASQDSDFVPVFLLECLTLLKKMNNGNTDLHKRAMNIVEKELARL